MAGFAAGFLVVDLLRLFVNPVKNVFIVLFGSLLRKKELTSLNGATYLLLSSLICMLFFGSGAFGVSLPTGRGVFIAATAFLVIGDTVAAIVGMSIGRVRLFRGKTLEGTLAGLAACILTAYAVSVLPGLDLPLRIGILGAVSAAVVEALPIEINDNVVVPITSGTAMMVASQVLS